MSRLRALRYRRHLVPLLSSGSRASGAAAFTPALLPSLAGWWAMEEGSGARADSSGNGLTLTDNNTVATAAGRVGLSANFTVADTEFLSRASEAGLEAGDIAFYWAAWVRFGTGGMFRMIASKMDAGTAGDYEFRLSNTDTLQFLAGGAFVAHASPLLTTTWYFVEAYHDPTANLIGVAINNGAFTTAATAGANVASSNAFAIGRRGAEANYYYDGLLDEVVFCKAIPSDALRTQLYQYGGGA